MIARAHSEPTLRASLPQAQQALCAEARARYMARQPIFDAERRIQGYELLHRDGPENRYRGFDGDAATCRVIDGCLLYGAPQLSSGWPAFINCTRNTLLSELITLLPREVVVAEVLEDVPADRETLAACERLREAGYRIALDDFVPGAKNLALLPYAYMVKVDFLATSVAEQAAIASQMQCRGIRLLAEKIETSEQFLRARQLGYQYFQGFYLSRPELLTIEEVPPTAEPYLQLQRMAEKEAYDLEKIAKALERDPALCWRLLLRFSPTNLDTRYTPPLCCARPLHGAIQKILKVAQGCVAASGVANLESRCTEQRTDVSA